MDDSASGGKCSTAGRGITTRSMRPESSRGTLTVRSRFLGLEMNEILWPFRAKYFDSSKNGRRWPMASHGNITMWRFLLSSSMVMGSKGLKIESGESWSRMRSGKEFSS